MAKPICATAIPMAVLQPYMYDQWMTSGDHWKIKKLCTQTWV